MAFIAIKLPHNMLLFNVKPTRKIVIFIVK